MLGFRQELNHVVAFAADGEIERVHAQLVEMARVGSGERDAPPRGRKGEMETEKHTEKNITKKISLAKEALSCLRT